jgi:hypothetical protein
VDGRLLRSFRSLVSRPGALTLAYVRGPRKPYLGPFQLFVLANVLFFAMQSLTHTEVFSTTLDSHLYHQDWSSVAQPLIAHRLEATQRTLGSYAPVFDRAVVPRAKLLIILMVLPFVLLLPILFRRNRQPFVTHAVFAVHLYTFLLLVSCVALALAGIDVLLGGIGLKSPRVDNVLSVLNLAACAAYLYPATGRVYDAQGASRAVKVLALTAAVAGLTLGYRFALLLITLYST